MQNRPFLLLKIESLGRGIALSISLVLLALLQGCFPVVAVPTVTHQEIQQEESRIPQLDPQGLSLAMNLRYGFIAMEEDSEVERLAREIVLWWRQQYPREVEALSSFIASEYSPETAELALKAWAIDCQVRVLCGHWPTELAPLSSDSPPADIPS